MLMIKGNRIKRFVLGALLADYYFLVLCSTVICRSSSGERQMVLMPFWKYPDIWNKVDYPADLLEVLLNIALKECNESRYWLRLLNKSRYLTKEEFDSIYKDSEEILKLLASITKTTSDKIKKYNHGRKKNNLLVPCPHE